MGHDETKGENKIAAIQMVSKKDLKDNLISAEKLLEQAAQQHCRMALLPETFSLLAAKKLRDLAEQEDHDGTVQNFLSQASKRLGLWIVGGTTALATRPDSSRINDGRVRAACLVYSDQGRLKARYDKIHLFDVTVNDAQGSYRESATMEAGDEVVVVDTPVGKLGLTVCYDLRFPELYSALARQGAELFSVPSAFTVTTGSAHWETLIRARAIENMCYVVGAGQGGKHSSRRETYGHSMIVDPWGKVMTSIDQGEGVITAIVDIARLHELRRQLPVHAHKRFKSVPEGESEGGPIGE